MSGVCKLLQHKLEERFFWNERSDLSAPKSENPQEDVWLTYT